MKRGKQGNRETGKQGERETGKQGNRERGREGEREARGQGIGGIGKGLIAYLRTCIPVYLCTRIPVYLWACVFLFLLAACSLVEDVPPVAHAGDDQKAVKLGAPIVLDASKSREIDGGSIVEYRWTIIGVPKGKESELNKVLATLKEARTQIQLPSDEGALGTWTLELRVTDNSGNRAANDVRVTLVK